MKKLMDVMNKWLPTINKFGANKYLVGMRNGISSIIPFTIIGSIFMILTNFPNDAWLNFIAPYADVLAIPANVCMGLMALIAVVSIAMALAKQTKISPSSTGFIALVAFIITQSSDGSINTANFGSTGLFLAILIAIVTVMVVGFFENRNVVIKLPDSVPEMVSESFRSLIPGFMVIVLFWLVACVFQLDLNALLSTLLSPLIIGLDTLPGTLLVILISTVLWCCGINEAVISGVTYPIWYALLAENTTAFLAGQAPIHFGAYGWQYFGFWLGGTGTTIGLVLLMLRSKCRDYKLLGQISLPPALFEINEPVAFGFPIVFNPIMMIPYIVTPLITTTLYWVVTTLGWVRVPVVSIPWTTPPLLSGFLATGGDWRASIFQLAMIILSVIIYYPFFKYSENKRLAEGAESV